ncbi:type 4a pilus biogenesis protein PilO [Candidatus Gottesmanbacteria bacterium]|nr:type 4a pilus biogenesis protein PilO [Candidatus Gottesmanbacteria bacterium]
MDYKSEFERYKRYYLSLETSVKKPAYRSYTAAIFSFLAISLFSWYAILPTLRTILYLRREISDDKKVSAQMEEKISALIEAQEVYQSISPRLPVLLEALPESPEAVSLVSQLKNLATFSEASLSGVQVGSYMLNSLEKEPINETSEVTTKTVEKTPKSTAITPKQPQHTLSVSLSLSGSYKSIESYVTGLMNMRRIVTIESIKIEPKTEGERSDAPLKLALRLVTYYTR